MQSLDDLDGPLRADLNALETAYDAGVALAVFDVLELSRVFGFEVPGWALHGLEALTEPGALEKAVRSYRRDLIDYERYETVLLLREHRDTVWKEYKECLKKPGLPPEARRKLEQQAPFDPGKADDLFARAMVSSNLNSPLVRLIKRPSAS